MAVLFVAVIAMTVWGWRVLPRDARFSFSIGVPPSVDGTFGKVTGLSVFIGCGLILAAGGWFAADETPAMAWIAIALLLYFLFFELLTIRRLKRIAKY